jgi:hypothetical protein
MTAEPKMGSESAYPVTPPCASDGTMVGGHYYPETGLTKRELFAAMAMQAVLRDRGGAGVPEYIAEAAVSVLRP